MLSSNLEGCYPPGLAGAPKMPFYLDPSGSLIDSSAAEIMRHIATEFDLLGKSRVEVARINMMEKQVLNLITNPAKSAEILS